MYFTLDSLGDGGLVKKKEIFRATGIIRPTMIGESTLDNDHRCDTLLLPSYYVYFLVLTYTNNM